MILNPNLLDSYHKDFELDQLDLSLRRLQVLRIMTPSVNFNYSVIILHQCHSRCRRPKTP